MTTVVANKIRLAEVAPPYCSSCFSQQTDKLHVDFMAAYDGPVMDGAKQSQIDDLIICESCLSEAASLLPDFNAAERERFANIAERNEILEAANAGQATYIEKLEAAIASKPEAPRRGARK